MEWKETISNGVVSKIHGWKITTNDFSILLTNSHPSKPHQWLFYSYRAGIFKRALNIPLGSTPKQAQEKAVEMVREKLTSLLNSIT